MSDPYEGEEQEIVDLDTCSKKKSILIGAAITTLLGLVPYSYMLFGLHFLIGGLAAAGHFAKRYSISISSFTGVKAGAMASFIGLLPILLLAVVLLNKGIGDADYEQVREQIVRKMYEEGNPEAADYLEKASYSDVKPLIIAGISVAGLGFSLVLGSLGGLIGAAVFKKGPEAQ